MNTGKIDLFNTNPTKTEFPRPFFQRIPIQSPREIFYYQIDQASDYFLRRLFCKIPSLIKDTTLDHWQPNTVYAQGAIIQPSTVWQAAHKGLGSRINIICKTGGQSGAAEPEWPFTFGVDVTDNAATWTTRNAFNIPCPRLNFFFIDNANFITRQIKAIPADLTGTPAQEGNYLIEAPNPTDNDLFGLNWNVPTPPTVAATLNYRYHQRDVIKIEITGQELYTGNAGNLWTPNYIDIFLLGYNCPSGKLHN